MLNALLNGLLQGLTEDERDAVSGDLLEAGDSVSTSVIQVFGLVLRRQILLWAGWRPWAVFIFVAFPLAVVLVLTARDFAGWSAVYSWILVDNADAALLRNVGFWHGAVESAWLIGRFAIVLFCCSWAAGRLVAQASRDSRLSVGVLFLICSVVTSMIRYPFHSRAFLVHPHDEFFPNGAVFALSFYRVWFPLIVFAATVLLPLCLGVFGAKETAFKSNAFHVLYGCWAGLLIVGLIDQPWLLRELCSWGLIPAGFGQLPSLLPVAAIGSAAYLLARWGKRGFAKSCP